MRIYMMTDLEGVRGVLSRDQVLPGSAAYEKARDWLTADVNAAVEGAIEGGADQVVVLDGHGANNATNIRYENVHPKALLIQGTPWRDYLHALDDSFGGLFQVGAHAMAGTPEAVLEHTMSSDSWVEMTINGRPTGEIGLVAAVAGYFGVPFVMVSGDDKACAESRAIVPGIQTAVVKHAITRGSAVLLPKETVDDLIKEAAREAVRKAKDIPPYVVESPVAIEVEYLRNDTVERVFEREGVTKLSSRRVRYTGSDIREAVRRWRGG